MKKTALILVIIFYGNCFCQEYSLSLFAAFHPNVVETRITQTSYNFNTLGFKFIVDSFLPFSILSGIELRYGFNNYNNLTLAPIRGCPMVSSIPFIESEKKLSLISAAIPVMYKVNDDPTANLNVGIYIRYSYFKLIDNLTRYLNSYNNIYSKSFTLYDNNWSIVPAIEINSIIKGGVSFFLGVEYNFNKSNFQITTNSESLNDFVYYQIYKTIEDFGNNIEYDFSGIGINIGVLYKI